MATKVSLEAAFEDAVQKLKNAQLDWITAKSEASSEESSAESSEPEEIEDFSRVETVDRTAVHTSENDHELRPVWFVPNIYQLRPILGYTAPDKAAVYEAGYSTCSEQDKAADHYTEVDESAGTTTLRPVEGATSNPYYSMYYGTDGQLYGCPAKLTVRGESTERSGDSVDDFGTKSAAASSAVDGAPSEGDLCNGSAEEYYGTEGEYEEESLYEVPAEAVGEVVDTDVEQEEEEEEYYDEVGSEDDGEKETVEDIADLAGGYTDYEEDPEYYVDEEAAYEEAVGYKEEAGEEVTYDEEAGEEVAYDEEAEEISHGEDEVYGAYEEEEVVAEEAEVLHKIDAGANLGEVPAEAEVYDEYEDDEAAEAEDYDEDYDEGEWDEEQQDEEEEYEEEEEVGYCIDAAAEQAEGEAEEEEVRKKVHYEHKVPKAAPYDEDLTKAHLGGNEDLVSKSTDGAALAPEKPGSKAGAAAQAYSFYRGEDEEDCAVEQCAPYPTGYLDAYGNPSLYNPMYVPVNGYY